MGTVFGLRLGNPIEPRVLADWDKHLQRFA
jgi:hypothetical protein